MLAFYRCREANICFCHGFSISPPLHAYTILPSVCSSITVIIHVHICLSAVDIITDHTYCTRPFSLNVQPLPCTHHCAFLSVSQSLSSTTSFSLSTVPSSPSSLHTPSSMVSLSAPSCTALTLGHEITEAVGHLGFNLEDSPLLSECQTQFTLSVDAGASPPYIVGKSQGKSKS